MVTDIVWVSGGREKVAFLLCLKFAHVLLHNKIIQIDNIYFFCALINCPLCNIPGTNISLFYRTKIKHEQADLHNLSLITTFT